MSWTFNPPPGWPVPPGWQPPPGWSPEPGWPPAPEGWQFWVPATPGAAQAAPDPRSPAAPGVHEAPTSMAYPPPQPAPQPVPQPAQAPPPSSPPAPPSYGGGYQPAGAAADQPWHQRWWAIAGAMLSVLLVGCVMGSAGALLTNSDEDDDDGGDGPPTGAQPTIGAPTPGVTEAPEPGAGGLGPGEERTGTGPTIITLDLPADALHTVTLTHTGEGVFHARLLDTEGEFARALGGGIGEYTGTFGVELRAFGEPGAIDIVDGDGSWTVEINDFSEAPLWPEQTEGSGAEVFRVDPSAVESEITVSFSHEGESNVFVYGMVEGELEDLMVNEIGDYSGEVSMRAGTFALEVDADGTWNIEP